MAAESRENPVAAPKQKTESARSVVRGFAGLAPEEWFTDRSRSSFWLRIASCVAVPPAELERAALSCPLKYNRAQPVVVAFGRVEGAKLLSPFQVVFGNDDGMPTIFVKVDQVELPRIHAWLLATPYRVDGAYPLLDAPTILSRVAGLMAAHIGRNALFHVLFEGEVNAATGDLTTSGDAVRTPQSFDGPNLHPDAWEALRDVADALRNAPRERRQRLELAIEFLDHAMREKDDFFSYWTALEVVANGKAPAARRLRPSAM